MKFFGNLFTVVAVVLVGAVNVLATTPTDIVNAFETVTEQSRELRIVTESINIANFPIQGAKVAQGLTSIGVTVQGFIDAMDPNMPAISDADATPIVDVLVTFVEVHQALLSVIIGKHGLFERFGVTAPVAGALRGLEGIVDLFAFGLIAVIPTKAPEAQAQFDSLSVTFTQTINTYSN
ncbi:hypothetical protein C8Q76DRAFT_693476 [Earliella scabrosa]|nr:hypothetical protein C8Q76DRAFT_693476 [Earliella scabrosa]